MINFDDYTNENKTKQSKVTICSRSSIENISNRRLWIRKNKCAILNLINNQPDINKIYLYAKDPYEAKCQYLINKCEKVGLNHYDYPKAFIEYSNIIENQTFLLFLLHNHILKYQKKLD